jgi:hypothetical protein
MDELIAEEMRLNIAKVAAFSFVLHTNGGLAGFACARAEAVWRRRQESIQ